MVINGRWTGKELWLSNGGNKCLEKYITLEDQQKISIETIVWKQNSSETIDTNILY